MGEWKSVYDSEAIVEKYDQRQKIVGVRVEERDEIVLNLIPYCEDDSFRILDLGAGMGRFTLKLKEKFPKSQIVCLDGSKRMLAIAKSRLEGYSKTVSFVCKDFSKASWIQGICGFFDLVVSSAAIHHISDIRKRELFSEIYNILNGGGYFINVDLINSQYDVLNKLYYDDIWAHQIQQRAREFLGIEREVENIRLRMYEAMKKEGDKPTTVENQIRWLHEAGFKVAECIWKYYLCAIIIGIK